MNSLYNAGNEQIGRQFQTFSTSPFLFFTFIFSSPCGMHIHPSALSRGSGTSRGRCTCGDRHPSGKVRSKKPSLQPEGLQKMEPKAVLHSRVKSTGRNGCSAPVFRPPAFTLQHVACTPQSSSQILELPERGESHENFRDTALAAFRT